MLTLGFRDVLIEDERIEYGRGDVVGQWWSETEIGGGRRQSNGGRQQSVVVGNNRFSKSSVQDMRINLAVSAVFVAWLVILRHSDYKPLQFLSFAFVYHIFEKLKSFERPVTPTYTEDGEEVRKGLQMGKRLLRFLALVFGCLAVASMAYTGSLNVIKYMASYELIITSVTSVMLYSMASYYR
ncbi:hypothetical protein M0R45_025788 [Rubus argutus]|uniref:Uncharacterized protein n=1 Tax=Rubus argutus TaxID=59490 RepID=A0AAW1WXY8_RUBAR